MPLFDLSARTKIRLSGPDRLRFLNGQVTNDVRKASPERALAACIVNAKGKLDAMVYIAVEAEALFLDAEPELRESLGPRLERYIIADDVALEDVSEQLALFHVSEAEFVPPNDIVITNEGDALVSGDKDPARAQPAQPVGCRRSKRFDIPGWDVVCPASECDRLRELLAAHYPLCDAECAERLRIERGLPRWGRELTNEIIPVEANLEAEAIDYAKGCYIGQEVISRMKMSGQTNKRLCGLISTSGEPLAVGMKLQPVAGGVDPGRQVGWITSATRSERLGKEIALGFVKRGFNEAGTRLFAGGLEVEVVVLPFA